MEGMTIRKRDPLDNMGWDMFNYLNCKDIDKFYTIVNIAYRFKRTSKIGSRGIQLRIDYKDPKTDTVVVNYINHMNDCKLSEYECNISDVKKAVAKAYKAASAHFFN